MADDKGDDDKIVFTDEQVAELKQAFALFDMDGSGEVSTDELGTVLETLGQKVTQEELVQIIAEVDQDGFDRPNKDKNGLTGELDAARAYLDKL